MRKTKDIAIPGAPQGTSNRDGGKKYRITEMSARAAEDWVVRAFLAINAAGVDISDEARAAGAASVISEGMAGFLRMKPADAIPLLDEMMACVQVLDLTHGRYRDLDLDDDIEEVATRFQLRGEVIELHTGFPVTAALSTLGAAVKRSMASPAMSTSPSMSEPSSAAD
jgi:hypothetical protein